MYLEGDIVKFRDKTDAHVIHCIDDEIYPDDPRYQVINLVTGHLYLFWVRADDLEFVREGY